MEIYRRVDRKVPNQTQEVNKEEYRSPAMLPTTATPPTVLRGTSREDFLVFAFFLIFCSRPAWALISARLKCPRGRYLSFCPVVLMTVTRDHFDFSV